MPRGRKAFVCGVNHTEGIRRGEVSVQDGIDILNDFGEVLSTHVRECKGLRVIFVKSVVTGRIFGHEEILHAVGRRLRLNAIIDTMIHR